MKPGFVVTSALNTRFGVFSVAERLSQTIATFDSIKEKCPDAVIALVEMAGEPLTEAQREKLQPHVNVILDFSKDATVQQIYKNPNWDIVKSYTEMYCFAHALESLKAIESFSGVDRIFKLSGRYILNEFFHARAHDEPSKVVVSRARASQFDPAVTSGNTLQYMTRCWSFDALLLDEIVHTYNTMRGYMVERVDAKGYVDIEHCLFKFIDHTKVIERQVIGVQGLLGPNGISIKD